MYLTQTYFKIEAISFTKRLLRLWDVRSGCTRVFCSLYCDFFKNAVVLHTNRVENVALKNTIEAVVKVVAVDFVKTVQSMLYGITRVTFHANEAKLRVLSQPFKIK